MLRTWSLQFEVCLLLACGLLAGCSTTEPSRQSVTVAHPPVLSSTTFSQDVTGTAVVAHAAARLPRNTAAPYASAPASIQPAGFQQVVPVSFADTPVNMEPDEVIIGTDLDAQGEELSTQPLDLSAALAMTQGNSPRVAFAQARVAQAYAQFEAARVLWLPSLRAGMNYNKHEGRLQDVVGSTIETSRGAAFGGLGANAVGAGSPAIPGVYLQFHVADAIFQRQIAGYALDAREFQATAASNDQLLDTALAYVALLEATERQAIAAETLRHGEELATLTAEFARTGAGSQADADRATAALAGLKIEAVRAEESTIVASARMAQQLSSDPTTLIVPQEPTVVPIELVPIDGTQMSDLVATGLGNRPELAASSSLVCEAVSRLRREERAPWLPSVLLGVSYGAFGAGIGGNITNGSDRLDFDSVAWWEIRNLGLGERAARDNARAQIQQAQMREVEMMDLVAREIVEAHSQARARKRQITIAEQGVAAAQKSYEKNRERIRNSQGLPIEVLQSIQALDLAQRDYLRAVVDYNTAQFRLHRALGWPVYDLRAPG